MAAKSFSKPFVWILMILLVFGLAGFGVTSLSGTLRTIGKVGEADLNARDYFQGLQNEIRAEEASRGEAISFARAEAQGIPQRVLGQLIVQGALDHETIVNGISVGDENLSEQILSLRQFTGPDGNFNREAYRFTLDQAGLNEREFEESTRREIARSFIQAAVLSGVTLPDTYMDTMLNYLGERRAIEWAILDRGDLEIGLPDPAEAELATYHTENADRFTQPQTKRISYAWLTPDMIIDTVEIDQTALQEAYDARRNEFIQPERRLVERLIFPDQASADAAKARLDAGEATFEDLVTKRGLELADTDMGIQTLDDLGAAGEAVFAIDATQIAGPAPTDLGPALFRVNAILSAQETTLEEAEPQLRDALAADRARRVIEARIEEIDDLLAGGATIEDLGTETEMQTATIDWHQGVSDDIAGYDGFRVAATLLSADDYPEVMELDDGGIYAMRLDEVIPPALQPLDQVREAVTTAWKADKVVELLRAQAETAQQTLSTGGTFEEAGLIVDGSEEITRRGFVAEAPPEFIETVFGMSEGDVTLIDGRGRLFVLKLNGIQGPDTEDPDLQQIETFLRNEGAGSLSNDLFQVLANDIRSRAGVTLDESGINAVHSNFQ